MEAQPFQISIQQTHAAIVNQNYGQNRGLSESQSYPYHFASRIFGKTGGFLTVTKPILTGRGLVRIL